jgi:hypothetical protein
MRHGGSSAGGLAYLVLVILTLMFIQTYVIPAVVTRTAGPNATLAMSMADQINKLPVINTQVCQGAPDLIANVLTVIQDMDGTLGTGFGRVAKFDAHTCDIAVGFVPILGSYNQIVNYSKTLDPRNSTSVTKFYEDLFVLSSDFMLVNDKVAYKVAFESTGDINDALRLNKLRDLCGDDCYRATLSAIHWSTREDLNQYMCEFENWASKSVQFDVRFC